VRGTTLQTPRSVQMEGKRCSRRQSRGSLQPMEQTMVRQAVPAAMEAHGGAEPHPQPGKDPTLEQGVPEGGCDPVGSPVLDQAPDRTYGPMERGAHTGAGLLAGLVTPWGTHTGAACS